MYLSRFSFDSGTWVQAVLRLTPEAGGSPPDFKPLLEVPGVNLMLRYDVRPEGATVLIGVAVPEKNEAMLERAVTQWRDAIGALDATVQPATNAAERDAWMDDVPPVRVKPGATFTAGGVPLLCTYLLFPNLEEILAAAAATKSRLVIQIDCLKSPLDQRGVGELRKQLVRLSFIENLPRLLLKHQDRTVRRLPDYPWAVEEMIAADSADDLKWLEEMIRDDFSETYAKLGFPALELKVSDDGIVDDCFATGFPSALLEPQKNEAPSGARLRQDELEGLCQATVPQKASPIAPPVAAPAKVAGVPEKSAEKLFDVFISYSTRDRQIANALCHLLERDGFRCWIAPREIRPGEIWAESIPRGIRTSRLVVVIFSESSNLSVHVLREVERAVHYGVIIIPFRIEDVPMTDGMSYLLATPHWFDAVTRPIETHLLGLAAEVRHQLGPRPPAPLAAKG